MSSEQVIIPVVSSHAPAITRAVSAAYRVVRVGRRAVIAMVPQIADNAGPSLRAGLEGVGLHIASAVAPISSTAVTIRTEEVAPQPEPAWPQKLRVALLGCGTVNSGVWERMEAEPDRFELVAVLVRDVTSRAGQPKAHLFVDSAEAVFAREPQIVVEAMGGLDPAQGLIKRALDSGADVATANKSVIAENPDFETSAALSARRLMYSAAVGGGVPVLETIDRLRAEGVDFRSVRGVSNGTSNFILDAMAAGGAYDQAVLDAQTAGFAEADPSADVDGHDAAAKIRIIARRAFGVELAADMVPRTKLSDLGTLPSGKIAKQVATCRRFDGGVSAEVTLDLLDADDFLAGARAEENRFIIETKTGDEIRLDGKGAGRAPTAEAVFADMWDIARARASTMATAV